jgi:hypothetical protein
VNEDLMHRVLMLAGMVLTILAGVGTIGLLILCAVQFSFAVLFSGILLAIGTVGLGWATAYYGSRVTGHPLVFTNDAEREVLNRRQRNELRKLRGEVVMQRAVDEVNKERENISFRQLQAANDPEKPPHETRWSKDGQQRALKGHGGRDRDRDWDQ